MDVIAKETRFVDRPLARAGRRRRQRGADRVRRLPGACAPPRSTPGARRRSRAGASASRASARSARTWSSTCSPTAPRWSRPTSARPRSSASAPLGPVETTDVDDAADATSTCTRPARSAASITDEMVPALRAAVVCGAANNQLAHPGLEKALADRGVLFTPDYVANAGGVVQVADEAQHPAASASTGRRRGPPGSSTPRCGSSSSPTARACRRRSPPTGSPSAAWPRSAACAASWCPAGADRSGRPARGPARSTCTVGVWHAPLVPALGTCRSG